MKWLFIISAVFAVGVVVGAVIVHVASKFSMLRDYLKNGSPVG